MIGLFLGIGLNMALLKGPIDRQVTSRTPALDTPAKHDKRMAWFRDARFGMFIHWGLYSVPAGYWGGKEVPGAAEWLQYSARVKPEDYEALQKQFNPVNFDANKWVSIAKNAGMKYIVITSKHHEGFGMWPSKLGTWNIGYTQFHRDPLKELAEACKKAGIRLCFYHSIMDWHHPDYLPRRSWDTRDASQASLDRYVQYMKGQLKELLTGYGPIGLVWFDGQWEDTWTHERGKDLYNYIRSLQPNIIVNNRVDTGRAGGGATAKSSDFVGDYGTPEQEIPANGIPGQDWESCMTMNDTWGFSAHDHNWKSGTTLIRNLIDCASKGGNYLLNVGPTSLGEIPDESVTRLQEVGEWITKNGDSVYGTTASPFPKVLPWGRVTQKPGKLFLHIFDHKVSGIDLPGLQAKVKGIHLLGTDPKNTIAYTSDSTGVRVQLPKLPDEASTVLEMDIEGKAIVNPIPLAQAVDGSVTLNAVDSAVDGSSAKYEEAKSAIGFWTDPHDSVSWTFDLKKAGYFDVNLYLACEEASKGSTFDVIAGDQKISGVVPNTGSWSNFVEFKAGRLKLANPGKVTITVKPTKLQGYGVMNLRTLRLVLNP